MSKLNSVIRGNRFYVFYQQVLIDLLKQIISLYLRFTSRIFNSIDFRFSQCKQVRFGLGIYQYTSINDCTRYSVLRLYKRRTAPNTMDFIDYVFDEMPFPIQRIQTDRTQFNITIIEREHMALASGNLLQSIILN